MDQLDKSMSNAHVVGEANASFGNLIHQLRVEHLLGASPAIIGSGGEEVALVDVSISPSAPRGCWWRGHACMCDAFLTPSRPENETAGNERD